MIKSTGKNGVAINSVNAIRSLVFEMPERGGVVVFTGHNGAGKSTAIRAMQGLLGGDVDLAPTRGTEAGEIQGFGRRMRVGKKKTVTGASSVKHLGNRLDLGKLVEPGVKDPDARSKYRINALVSLGAKQVTPEDFLRDDLIQHVDVDSAREISDPVAMATFIKRAVDRAALESEKDHDVQAKLAEAKRIEAGDIDELNAAGDQPKLLAEYQAAMTARTDAERELEQRERDRLEAERIAKLNSQTEAELTGMVWAGGDREELEDAQTLARAKVARIEKELAAAKAALLSADNAIVALDKHEEEVAKLQARIVKPTDRPKRRLESAKIDVDALKQAETEKYTLLQNVERIADRKRALAESIRLTRVANSHNEKAVALRAAANEIQNKIQTLLPAGPVRLVDGELVIDRDGENIPVDELSDGERWSLAMHYAVSAVGEGGVIPVSQEAWQSLDHSHRSLLLELALENKVTVVTAEVDDGDLRAELYE